MGVKENIIRLRQLTGVTQEELGRIAGVSRSAVSLWEIGDEEFEARYGTRLRLYLPSTVTSSNTGGTADGGYEGQ